VSEVFEAGLLEAMLSMIQGRGFDAVAVTGYRERSYNIGYCETCSEMVTEVRIYYLRKDGSPGEWEYLGDLGELIRELTPEASQTEWLANAVREPDDERWDRGSAHSFDDEPAA
jgi:hypothetical protein